MSSSQAERLSSIIEEEILTLKIKPGDRLDEARLAERYGTSRTPVREALRQLSAYGLIELRPHKGAVVVKLGIDQLVEIMEVVAELEGACGRLAAKSYRKRDLEAIGSTLSACQQYAAANDFQSYKLANEAFHDAISQASGNSCLINLTRRMRRRVAAYRRVQFEQVNRIKSSAAEHARVAQAIQDGRAEEADRLLQLHMLQAGADLRRLISMVAAHDEGRGVLPNPDSEAFTLPRAAE